MKKIPSVSPTDGVGEVTAFFPNAEARKSLVARKVPKHGQKLGQLDTDDSSALQQDAEAVRIDRVSVDLSAHALGAETASSLPGLLDAPVESFTMLAQAPAAAAVSTASEASSAGLLGGASATTIGAVALGVVAVGAAASSGGSSSGPKAITPPTIAAGTAGSIAVTVGADASTAKLYAGTTDITAKFTSAKVGSVVTFTPVAGQVEYTAQSITAKAADASGTLSVDSSSVSYTFDNVPPAAAPTVAAGAAGAIAVTIGPDATTAKVFAGTTDITAKFTAAKVGSVVTFTPVAGQVEFVATAVTAKAADASGNLSGASTALTYSFDNVPPAAAPTVAAGTVAGTIAVTIGTDATTATLYAGTTDITSKFTAAKVGSVVTFTPVAGQVEFVAAAVTAKAGDAAGNLSAASTALAYSFDNVPPAAAPTVAAGSSGTIAVTIGSDATSAKVFAGATDITSKFTSAKVGSVVTFTPVAGQVEFVSTALTAKAADVSGNLSPASVALTYSYDNVAPAAAPTVAAGSAGAIAVTIGSDATTAKLFNGTTDIGYAFTAAKVGSVVTFTPIAASVEVLNLAVTAKAADPAGNLSAASSALTYTFDNIPPAAAPTALANATTGAIAVTIGTDATTAFLYAGTTDISAKFTSAKVGSVVTFTPVAGQVEYAAQALTAKAADASGNLSPASTSVSYSFDNVAPPSPTSVSGNSTNGVVTVNFGTSSGQVASTVKLFAGTTDISAKYLADTTVAGVVTYTPIAGQVELTAQTLKATVADAAGNASASTTAAAAYTFDNAIDITAANVSSTAYSAANANYAYTVNEGTYALSIANFGAGDTIAFKGTSAPSLSVSNVDYGVGNDGSVVITGSFAGSNGIVDLTVANLSVAQDSAIRSEASFNTVFGSGSLTTVGTPLSGSSSSVSIASATSSTVFDATGSNVAYTISEGNYSTTITNFTAGDSIKFSGTSAASLSVTNADYGLGTDGTILITATFPDSGNVIDLSVKGLTAAADAQIRSDTSFNTVFGTSSLGSTAAISSTSQTVAIAAKDSGKTFSATGGDFAYTIDAGNYSATIDGFDKGDSLSFFGANVASLSVKNDSYGAVSSVGILVITGTFNGQVVDLTLTGLSSTLDALVRGEQSFKNAFGSSSLIA